MWCRLDWRIGNSKYHVAGKFWHFAYKGEVYWGYKFRGTRTRLTCRQHCTRKVGWR